jgi:transcriptional regulator with XRE-family HTH domain
LAAGIAPALRSTARRSAEEWVTEDWAAVGTAIKDRRKKLGITQTELGHRAKVSKQMVGEIENNKLKRRRGPRTLEALSVALGWHPSHLAAVLAGHTPPRKDEPVPNSDDDIPGHMSVLEHYMRKLLDEVETMNGRLDDLTTKVDTVTQRTCSDEEQPKD